MYISLWKEDIEEGESVMTAEYRTIEYGKDYDVVNNPDKMCIRDRILPLRFMY